MDEVCSQPDNSLFEKICTNSDSKNHETLDTNPDTEVKYELDDVKTERLDFDETDSETSTDNGFDELSNYGGIKDPESPVRTDSQDTDVRDHKNTSRKNNKTTCSVCNKVLSKASVSTHMKTHKNKDTCTVCDKTFKHRFVYEGHMREHAGEENPYWCGQCEKKFPSARSVIRHRKMHTLKGRWVCSLCGAVFTRKDYYKDHMKVHADPQINKCEVCEKQFSTPGNLKKHMVLHQEVKPYNCDICQKGFSFISTYRYHMKSHSGGHVRPYECDVCESSFLDKGGLTKHMTIHTGAKPYACGICEKAFSTLPIKQRHELTHIYPSDKTSNNRVVESEEQRTVNIAESYACEQCLFNFTHPRFLDHHRFTTHKEFIGKHLIPCFLCETDCDNQRQLTAHIYQHHCHAEESSSRSLNTEEMDKLNSTSSPSKDNSPLKCNFCEKITTRDKMREHMRTHAQKCFVCRECGITFHLASNLKNHLRHHTGETPYECKDCGKRFRTSDSLKYHRNVHTDESSQKMKHQCPTCGKLCLTQHQLKRHSWSHLKRHKCRICRQIFVDISLLEKHKATHSGSDVKQ